MGQLITKYQQRGGSLPPGFGAELTDEQRTLLAERIKTEKAGLRTLLQDLIDRDKEVQQMKTRLDQLETQLPASVVAKEGDRHDRIAMNFLVKQGVPAKKAYEIVSQINLQDALVPGFRVWTYYQKGQFGTWVTRGKANITPQEHAKKILALLEEERDKALKDLADTSSERDALKTGDRGEGSGADALGRGAEGDDRDGRAAARRGAAPRGRGQHAALHRRLEEGAREEQAAREEHAQVEPGDRPHVVAEPARMAGDPHRRRLARAEEGEEGDAGP